MAQRGYNTNLASEFHVLSLLHRLGLDAYLTLGNKKSVDIVVTSGPDKLATVDVKAVAKPNDWMSSAPPRKPIRNHFVVLIGYEGRFDDPTFVPQAWVLPHDVFLAHLQAAKTKTAWFLPRRVVRDECGEYRDAWHLLTKAIS